MPRIPHKPPFTRSYRDRHGVVRWEFRRKGLPSRRLPGPPGTPGFEDAYQAALDGRPKPIAADRTTAGTVDDLLVRFFTSREITATSVQYRKNLRSILRVFRERYGGKPVARMERRHVKKALVDCANTPIQSNKLLKTLRRVMRFAVDEDMREDDPTAGVRPVKIDSDGYHAWTEAEIDTFRGHHASGTRPRLALELALATGQRRSDVARMGWGDVDGGLIRVRQMKTKTELWIPILLEMADEIAQAPKDIPTFMRTQYGKEFTPAGFGNWFREQCDAAGLAHCAMHGLRKAAARRLAEAGCTDREIMSITGHKHAQEVTRYTESADQKRLAQQAAERLKLSPPGK